MTRLQAQLAALDVPLAVGTPDWSEQGALWSAAATIEQAGRRIIQQLTVGYTDMPFMKQPAVLTMIAHHLLAACACRSDIISASHVPVLGNVVMISNTSSTCNMLHVVQQVFFSVDDSSGAVSVSHELPGVPARLFKTPFARGAHRDAHWAVIGGMRCVAKLYLGLGGGLQETLAALHEVHNLSRGMMNIALEMGV